LAHGNSEHLRYWLPGPSILHELVAELPDLQSHCFATDLPYAFSENDVAPAPPSGPVTFGSLGVARKNKGSHQFFNLARSLHTAGVASRFVQVGPVFDASLLADKAENLELTTSEVPLESSAFRAHMRRLHYAVFCLASNEYRLTASASFFDALAHEIPVIALRNRFIEHYFEKMGDIGYMCDSYGEMESLVTRLSTEFPSERHRAQIENIRHGRASLRPEQLSLTVASQLKDFWTV
jgi:hypothetical protein